MKVFLYALDIYSIFYVTCLFRFCCVGGASSSVLLSTLEFFVKSFASSNVNTLMSSVFSPRERECFIRFIFNFANIRCFFVEDISSSAIS